LQVRETLKKPEKTGNLIIMPVILPIDMDGQSASQFPVALGQKILGLPDGKERPLPGV
jgi:hypothetical protein